MTLRQLFQMAQGREQSLRRHALTQAGLFFAEDADIAYFIQTGSLDVGGGDLRIPYDPEIPRRLQEKLNGRAC